MSTSPARLLGIPTWLLVPGRSVADSLYACSCAVSFLGPEPPDLDTTTLFRIGSEWRHTHGPNHSIHAWTQMAIISNSWSKFVFSHEKVVLGPQLAP